jgi:tagatose 1,6-diphosphate aldolase
MAAIKDIGFIDPPPLCFGDVQLALEKTIPADHVNGFVPVYRFGIKTGQGRVGHISFKVGDIGHITRYVGHVGYEIRAPYRGNGYAAQACLALRPFIRHYYSRIVMTCDPDNQASIRTIEKIGGVFVDRVIVPEDNILRKNRGVRRKNRYVWEIQDGSNAPGGHTGEPLQAARNRSC